jgi:hypothetical protein
VRASVSERETERLRFLFFVQTHTRRIGPRGRLALALGLAPLAAHLARPGYRPGLSVRLTPQRRTFACLAPLQHSLRDEPIGVRPMN